MVAATATITCAAGRYSEAMGMRSARSMRAHGASSVPPRPTGYATLTDRRSPARRRHRQAAGKRIRGSSMENGTPEGVPLLFRGQAVGGSAVRPTGAESRGYRPYLRPAAAAADFGASFDVASCSAKAVLRPRAFRAPRNMVLSTALA